RVPRRGHLRPAGAHGRRTSAAPAARAVAAQRALPRLRAVAGGGVGMTSNLAEARFVLPPGSEASGPPEARGLARDEVRMAVVTADRPHHRQAKEPPPWPGPRAP